MTAVVSATFVAPAAGVLPVTVGGVVSDSVVNDHVTSLASSFQDASLTPCFTVATYVVKYESGADGVSVAVSVAAL